MMENTTFVKGMASVKFESHVLAEKLYSGSKQVKLQV